MTESEERPVTVLGGTGFLGREIAKRLAGRGRSVRVAVRHPGSMQGALFADVRDEASLAKALEGAGAVVNAVGLYVERGEETFEAVHVQGARAVALLCAAAGIARLVHISGIGVDAGSESSYVRARAKGEALVREAFPEATILRPSALFGPGDALFGLLAAIAWRTPVIPLFGRGETRLQPVYLGDVAEAVARALEAPTSVGEIYELGGPEVFSYRTLVELVLAHLGLKRLLLPLPFAVWELQARLFGLLTKPPLTRDQVALMKQDNLVGEGARTLADLGVAPTPVAAVLPAILGPPPPR